MRTVVRPADFVGQVRQADLGGGHFDDLDLGHARAQGVVQRVAFREGQATSLDVIDVRLGLGGARVERAQAAYQYDIALAQLLEISGQMDRFEEFRRRADEVIDHE